MRRNSTGELVESLPELVSESFRTPLNDDPTADGDDYDTTHVNLTTDTWALFSDKPIALRRAHSLFLPLPPAGFDEYTIVAFNIYRGRGNLFGFIGTTDSREFVDVGDEPVFAHQPPTGADPFGTPTTATGAAAPFDALHPDRPSAVAYFEQRRVFGGLTRREQDLIASATGDFDKFDTRKLFHIAGESLIITIAARRRGRIRHLVPLSRLVILTASASFHGGGSQTGDPLDWDSFAFPFIENVGANEVTPVVVDEAVLFVRAKGHGIRGLVSGGHDAGFQGFDASQWAEHLFRGAASTVVSMCHAGTPWGTVWAAREDGVLLSLTFQQGQDPMLAWARHELDGEVESVCAVPEGDEDAVYLVVKRTINGVAHRYVERMTSRHERGGAVLQLDDGTARSLNLLTETPPDHICIDCAVGYVGPAAQVFTGLAHLEGKSVYVVVQGQPVRGPFVVAGGSIDVGSVVPVSTIDDFAHSPAGRRLVAYIGLLYQPELELLDVIGDDARKRRQQVTAVGFEVDQARGVKVGQDFDHLTSPPPRAVADGFDASPLKSEVMVVSVAGRSDLSARAVLRQTYPLPCTVVGISRKVVAGEP